MRTRAIDTHQPVTYLIMKCTTQRAMPIAMPYSRLLTSIVARNVSQMRMNSERDTIRRDRNRYSVMRLMAMYLSTCNGWHSTAWCDDKTDNRVYHK